LSPTIEQFIGKQQFMKKKIMPEDASVSNWKCMVKVNSLIYQIKQQEGFALAVWPMDEQTKLQKIEPLQ
jgi:hypothetical protein